ncbi:Secondary metabolism regulator laeA [Paramyrothecium foliicola]|nr:Secondary metabolism regulator laeA [Paramyrothecium foliicola]
MDRNDLQHCKFTLLTEVLCLAPMPETTQKILHMATGSGIWAIDGAENYPSAEVIGVDAAATQPSMVPSNLFFRLDDIESEWPWPEASFDLIYGRELILVDKVDASGRQVLRRK